VKTYAHALKLHEERLQDATKRRGQLEYALANKRLELLTLKQEQLAARQQSDPAVEALIAETRERIRAYEAPPPPPAPAEVPKGLVQLRKKTADGFVAVQSQSSSTAAAE